MKFDLTVSLGNILTILAMLLTGLAAYVRFSSRLDKLEIRMELVFDWWQNLWGQGTIPPLPPRRRRTEGD